MHTVYKTTNTVNGKVYIGKHTTNNPNDSYLGSGIALNKAIVKYGRSKFTKDILGVFEDETGAYLFENSVVDAIFISRQDTYNAKIGGRGALAGSKHPMYNKRGEHNPMYGKKHTSETKTLLSQLALNRTQETKDRMAAAKAATPHVFLGKRRPDHSEKMKQNSKFVKCTNPSTVLTNTMQQEYYYDPVVCRSCGDPVPYPRRRYVYCRNDCLELMYLRNPNKCKQCDMPLPYATRKNKCCSRECAGQIHSVVMRKSCCDSTDPAPVA